MHRLSSQQLQAIASILDNGGRERTATCSSSSSCSPSFSLLSSPLPPPAQLAHPPPLPPCSPPLLSAAASDAAESLLCRLLTPPAHWHSSTAEFLSSLTGSPTVQRLLRCLLALASQQQPLSSPPPALLQCSLPATLELFLSSLESELCHELRLPAAPAGCGDALLSFHLRLSVAAMLQDAISQCRKSAAPARSFSPADCCSTCATGSCASLGCGCPVPGSYGR